MFDLVIKNGKIIDGTGSPSFFSDIAIKDGKITRVGKNLGDAKKIIDASGLTVTPGFIDSHSHSDNALIDFPDLIEKTEQGITTSIAGQCGGSPAPANISPDDDKFIEGIGKMSEVRATMGSFLDTFKNIPLGSNTVCLVGHGTIRKSVMGMKQSKPTQQELEKMKDYLRDAMEHGALGISFGLIYPPSCYADTDELIEMAKVVKEYNGIVASHIRGEGMKLAKATKEFLDIVKAADVRGVLSHHKACGEPENWGKVSHTLRMIDEANAEGFDVYCDVYPYVATHTTTSVTFVPDSGRDLLARLADADERQKMKEWNLEQWWANDLSWTQIAKCAAYPQYEGLFIPEIAKLHGTDEYEAIFDMILHSKNDCSACYFTMCEEDVETVMAHPRAMICTDASVAKGKTVFHPRTKGSFPRVLGRYVRERNVTTLPEMIRKMTSMPAAVYGLKTKGLIWEGMDADICIFDADKIKDNSEFTNCNERADGLNYVIIGGEVVAENAVYNGKRMGKLILRD